MCSKHRQLVLLLTVGACADIYTHTHVCIYTHAEGRGVSLLSWGRLSSARSDIDPGDYLG